MGILPNLKLSIAQQDTASWMQHYGWPLLTTAVLITSAVALLRLKQRINALEKQNRFEKFRSQELKKKLQHSLNTLRSLEENPDLIHSREFNLDYLRMKMAEPRFHTAIVNQVKNRVKEQISLALRESQPKRVIGIASTGRQVNRTFDVEYRPSGKKAKTGVLFRIQIRLVKLPMQATSVTVQQVVDCLEAYMSPVANSGTWQPTLQGRIVTISWDQSAKPTPLLVLEQLSDGTNVTFRTQGIA
ncbi:MAG: hypothetical protein ACFB5Z_13415 [Elainellaceae cyanobacterium]